MKHLSKEVGVGFMMLFAGSVMFVGGIATIIHGWKESGTIGMAAAAFGLAFALFVTSLLTRELLREEPKTGQQAKGQHGPGPSSTTDLES